MADLENGDAQGGGRDPILVLPRLPVISFLWVTGLSVCQALAFAPSVTCFSYIYTRIQIKFGTVAIQ